MQIIRKVAPGQKGAEKLLDQYGSKPVCMRYRYDEQKPEAIQNNRADRRRSALVTASPHLKQ